MKFSNECLNPHVPGLRSEFKPTRYFTVLKMRELAANFDLISVDGNLTLNQPTELEDLPSLDLDIITNRGECVRCHAWRGRKCIDERPCVVCNFTNPCKDARWRCRHHICIYEGAYPGIVAWQWHPNRATSTLSTLQMTLRSKTRWEES